MELCICGYKSISTWQRVEVVGEDQGQDGPPCPACGRPRSEMLLSLRPAAGAERRLAKHREGDRNIHYSLPTPIKGTIFSYLKALDLNLLIREINYVVCIMFLNYFGYFSIGV